VLYGARARGGSRFGLAPQAPAVGLNGVLGKMKSWFQGNF
jgi:hypothetical protein